MDNISYIKLLSYLESLHPLYQNQFSVNISPYWFISKWQWDKPKAINQFVTKLWIQTARLVNRWIWVHGLLDKQNQSVPMQCIYPVVPLMQSKSHIICTWLCLTFVYHYGGLVQDCSIFSALVIEKLQSCTNYGSVQDCSTSSVITLEILQSCA